MLEFKHPEPKAALTWIAVWVIALIALAMVPMDGANSKFAATPDKLHYSQGTNPGVQGASVPAEKVRG